VIPSKTWLQSFTKASQAKFFLAEPRHLTIYAYALARLDYKPPNVWIESLLESAQPFLGRRQGFNAQNLSNLAWVLGKWR
jgi:hypothetical protein